MRSGGCSGSDTTCGTKAKALTVLHVKAKALTVLHVKAKALTFLHVKAKALTVVWLRHLLLTNVFEWSQRIGHHLWNESQGLDCLTCESQGLDCLTCALDKCVRVVAANWAPPVEQKSRPRLSYM